MLTQNLPDFWERRYNNETDGWDLKGPTPALLNFLKQDECPKEGRVLILGAGRGYDAEAWAKAGYDTTAVDFCPTSVDALESLSRKYENLHAIDLDLFEMNPKQYGEFDIIFEYTCFSAIHPGRRDEFFEVWHKMLKDDGLIVSLFFPISNASPSVGPPHSTSEGELMARLDGIFDIQNQFTPQDSIPEREGKEMFWLLKKVL